MKWYLFADAVHPTHAVRPVGCWAPKDTPIAVAQTSGRQRLNIHGAIDLETGHTRMLEVETVDAVSTIKLIALLASYPLDVDPSVPGQRQIPPREAGAGMAGAAGLPDQASLHPGPLWRTSGLDRTTTGDWCTNTSPTEHMPRDLQRLPRGDPHVPARKYPRTGASTAMRSRTTSASSRPRIFGFWRERGRSSRTHTKASGRANECGTTWPHARALRDAVSGRCVRLTRNAGASCSPEAPRDGDKA